MIPEGNAVAVRWELRGTHERAIPGLEPTGTGVSIRGMNSMHIEDGKITEDQGLGDSLDVMN